MAYVVRTGEYYATATGNQSLPLLEHIAGEKELHGRVDRAFNEIADTRSHVARLQGIIDEHKSRRGDD